MADPDSPLDLDLLGKEFHRQMTLKRPDQTLQYDIAKETARSTSRSLPELRIKAEILLEYLPDHHDDIVAILTRSLCTDILKLSDASQEIPDGR